MKKDNTKPILKFEPGSRQPFILYLISITIVSAVIVIVCLFASGLSFSDDNKENLGDINLDGIVDAADVLMLSQHLTGNSKLNEEQLVAADVDNNGEVNSKDSMLIIQYLGSNPENSAPAADANKPAEPTSENTEEGTTASADNETTEQTTKEETTAPEISVDFAISGKSDNMAYLTGENGVYYAARISNSWKSSDGKYMYQVEVSIKNNSAKTVYNTSADINFSNPVDIEKDWNCTATNNENGAVKLKTQNDGRILTGGTFNCGFVISAGCPITINSVTK